MKIADAPDKIVLPFADAGAKNAVPVPSQVSITPGAASYTTGFPPLTLTPISSGGIPPFGEDMNGILFAVSALNRWANAGAGFVYDGTFANDADIGGYPEGARILRTDGLGYWLNTVDDNVTDPESSGAAAAGWVPDTSVGIAAVSMTSSNVTLTPLEYGLPIIVLSGVLTTNLNLIFPDIVGKWIIVNNCTGAFTITAKTSGGAGIVVGATGSTSIYGDAVNIYISFYGLPISGGTMTGALNTAQGTNIASAGTVNLTTATGNYVHITGTTTITGITLQQGASRTVVFDGALTLTNGASLILPAGYSIQTAAGDTAVFFGEAAGVVRCVEYKAIRAPVAQTVTDFTSASYTFAHGLGAAIAYADISVHLTCLITDAGYAVNDVVRIATAVISNEGFSLQITSSNVIIFFPSGGFSLANAGGGGGTALSAASKWSLSIVAKL